MKAEEILERLEQAKMVISSLPEDAEILSVRISTLEDEERGEIHLVTPVRHLFKSGEIKSETFRVTHYPGEVFFEDGVSIDGFTVFSIRTSDKIPVCAAAGD